MNNVKLPIIALFSSLCLMGSLSATLKWESKTLVLRPSFEDKNIEGSYKFTNTGDHPINIFEVKSTCGCTVPELTKVEYAPGESGQIDAKFDIGYRKGVQEKQITVYSDDPENPEVKLDIRVEIPEVVTIHPAFVFWRMNDDPEAKTVTLDIAEGYTGEITSLSSDDLNFSISGKALEKGKSYSFDITPVSTEHESKAMFRIYAKINGVIKIYTVHARVK